MKRHRKAAISGGLSFVLLFSVGLLLAQVTSPAPDDAAFLRSAALGCLWKTETGKVAAARAAAEEVRAFGKRMGERYSAFGGEVDRLAGKHGVALPGGLDAAQANTLAYLSTRRAAEVDREYISMIADDLTDDVKGAKREAAQGKDPEVRALAARMLDALQADLRETDRIIRGLPLPVLK